jgi:murein DD-endopeptidase MepM/ murein hydrolase activator NlpD
MEENGLPLSLYYNLDDNEEKISSDIRSHTIYQILRDKEHRIRQVLIPLNEELQLHIYREGEGNYSLEIDPIRYQSKDAEVALSLESVFSKDVVKKTGNFQLAVALEQLFRKEVAFNKLKKGDKVVAFYRQKVRMGKFYGTQKVYAAMIQTGGKSYYQFLANDGNYYDEKGRSHERSSFIVPCKYRRISSRFTLKRWHPILHKYRAHHGIDYAGPIGTPIRAAYDGKVIFMGRKGGYGNTIIIRHKGGYKTLYAHLSRFNNRIRGKVVKKGTIIGYMGNSGMSTGPHLHFGLSLHDRWIDPAKKIVLTKQLTGKKRQRFLEEVRKYKAKIATIAATTANAKGGIDGKTGQN